MRSRVLWSLAIVVLAIAAWAGLPVGSWHGAQTQGHAWGSFAVATEGDGDEGPNTLAPIDAYRLLDLTWSPGPFPGSEMSVLAGDPQTGMHHIYLKLPDGCVVPPHWHSFDEYVTVVSGTVLFGKGEKVVSTDERLFGPGAFLHIPAKVPHWARAKGEVVLSQTRAGAVDFHWTNPNDNPAHKKGEAVKAEGH